MGVIKATIHVDTSYNNGICQTGYIINIGNNILKEYSTIFSAVDNNVAEIKGIQIAVQRAVEYYLNNHSPIHYKFFFTVYNDNIIAITVTDHSYVPSKKIKDSSKYKETKLLKEWCIEKNVILNCNRKKRSRPIMKECDKLSKIYRKNKRWKYLK